MLAIASSHFARNKVRPDFKSSTRVRSSFFDLQWRRLDAFFSHAGRANGVAYVLVDALRTTVAITLIN